MSVIERTIYQCPLCDWWEGDADGEGVGHCNGRPAASHALVEMEQVAVVPQPLGAVGALEEARALIETAEQDGYVSEGWREDARTWQASLARRGQS